MFSQKTIFGLFLVAIMTLFLNSPAKAEERTIFFEKGDAIYSDLGENSPFGSLGHAGLYWYWQDIEGEEPNNPDAEDYKKQHKVIESNTDYVSRALLGYYTTPGVQEITFEQFYDVGDFWSVRTNPNLSWKQRFLIVNIAERQIGSKYHFFRGYKSPGRSFRCDGLVEYCYEQVGVDLISGDTWSSNIALLPGRRLLFPYRQMKSSQFEIRTEAKVKEVRLEPSEEGTLKAYASDGDKGSGITMVEFWKGPPDDTPDGAPGGVRLGKDNRNVNVGGEYTYYYGGTVAQLYAKAFDQAGNTKVTRIPLKDTWVLFATPNGNYSNQNRVLIDCHWATPPRGYYTFPSGYATLHLCIIYPFTQYHWGVPFPYDINVYSVDGSALDVQTVTWNTQPPLGPLIFTAPSGSDWTPPYALWFEIPVSGLNGIMITTTPCYSDGIDRSARWPVIFSTKGGTISVEGSRFNRESLGFDPRPFLSGVAAP